jgi:hypothetical protein
VQIGALAGLVLGGALVYFALAQATGGADLREALALMRRRRA